MVSVQSMFPNADSSFDRYFELLGYDVSYEGRLETGERWYEIYDDGKLAFQISMPPPPIAELIADLPHLIECQRGIGPTDYWCACEDTNKLRDLLRRVQSASALEATS